jgi:hypothetical protein
MEAQEAIRTAYRTTMQTHRKSKGRERSISQIPHTSAVHTARITHHLQRIRVYPCQIKKSLTPQTYRYDRTYNCSYGCLLCIRYLCRQTLERVYTGINRKIREELPPNASSNLNLMAQKTRVVNLTPIDAVLLRKVFDCYIDNTRKQLQRKNLAPITRRFIDDDIECITELMTKIFNK